MKRRSWVQPSSVAEYFDVSCSTVRQWISEGRFRAAKLPTGHLRILARDVIKGLLQQGLKIPAELEDLSGKHVLIADPDGEAARTMAKLLRARSGCRVTVAVTASDVRGLLNGCKPDLVVLGVRQERTGSVRTDQSGDLIILVHGLDGAPENGSPQSLSFSVNDILSVPVDERALLSSVAQVLLS